MKKKNILWIFLAVLVLAVLLILGNRLTEKMLRDTPPVVLAPSESELQEAEKTEPSSIQEELPVESTTEQVQEEETTSATEATSQESAPRPTPPSTTPPASEGEDLQARIDALVAEVYGLKDYYIGQLAY